MFLISSLLGASGRQGFVIVAFPGYLHLYVNVCFDDFICGTCFVIRRPSSVFFCASGRQGFMIIAFPWYLH